MASTTPVPTIFPIAIISGFDHRTISFAEATLGII
jgi:hypothetical protein